MEIGHSVRARSGLIICAAWALIALAWTPPTILVDQFAARNTLLPSVRTFSFVLASFVPWMAATPFILWLNQKFAVSQNRVAAPIAINLLVGLLLIPIITLAGRLLSIIMLQRHVDLRDAHGVLRDVVITSLYAIPTYIAVLAIGQALAYFERDRARERTLATARLQTLQAQINPHFLFNTLNAISLLGYRDPVLADSALSQLSELLRLSLKDRPPEIALKEEIAFARGYLDLYGLLMQDRLKVTFDIDAAVWNALVPVMLLQPLIENSLIHGVAKLSEGGRILISASERDGKVALSIINDRPTSAEFSSGFGIGLSNTRERLHALYGQAHLEFDADSAGAARVTVLLPKRNSTEAP